MNGKRLADVAAAALVALAAATTAYSPTPAHAAVRAFDHVVVVIEENHSFDDILGHPDAAYLDSLATQGVSFTNSFAITHPSQPNYLALFSGDTQRVTDDSCPQTFHAVPNLASQLTDTGHSFAGYSEDIPAPGYTGCAANGYARKHAPWVDFDTAASAQNRPFTTFPTDYRTLPSVSFVVPNLSHDMHDGTIAAADSWLKTNLDGYARWAVDNNSLLIITWDEDDFGQANQIPTIFFGARVRPGAHSERIDHYTVLRTLEDIFGLAALGHANGVSPITDAWSRP